MRRRPQRSPLSLSRERLFCTRISNPTTNMTETMERYDPQSIELKWQKVWADEQSFHVPNPDPTGDRRRATQQVVRARDAPVPVGRSPHGAHARLHDRRRGHALPPAQGLAGAAPDGLRRLRPARRERRDQGGRASAPVTERNIVAIREQMHRMGWSIDWGREISTHDPATTAGRSGCSSASSSAASPTARRRRSSGARTTRRCSRTSRSSTAVASAAAPRSRRRCLTQWFFRITDYARRAARRDGAAGGLARVES